MSICPVKLDESLVCALLFVLAFAVTASGAHAFDAPGLSCNDDPARPDTCRIDLAEGLAIEAGRSAIFPHTDGLGYDVFGNVQIPTGQEPLELAAADMRFREIGGRSQLQYATALLPFPAMGFLSAIEVTRQPMVSFGVRTGEELGFTGAPVQPDRSYFYFFGDAALEAGYGPISFSSGGSLLSVVLDPTDPYFYVGAEMAGLGGDDGKDADSKKAKDGQSAGTDGQAGDGSGGQNGPDSVSNADGADGESGQAENGEAREGEHADEKAKAEEAPEEDGGVSVPGVAFSLNGLVPFEPLNDYGVEDEIPEFDGHLFVRGPIPIYQGLTLNGDAVIDVDPDEDGDHPFEPTFYDGREVPDLAIGGNGALEVGIPFLEFFEYGFEVGDGTAIGFMGEKDQRAVFSGELALDQSSFLGDLPIGIEAGGRVAIYGVFQADLLKSFIHAEGEMALDPSAIGRSFGVELGPVASSEMMLDISAMGLFAQGSTSVSPFPALGFAEAGAETFISTNGLDSYFAIRGAMALDGIALENAEFKAHLTDGVTIAGAIQVGNTEFDMLGIVGANGYSLEGTAQLQNAVKVNAQQSVGLADEILQHEANRQAIKDSLTAASASLEAARWSFDTAEKAVNVARIPVDKVNASVAYHKRHASSNYGRYKSAKRKRCGRFSFRCKAKRAWNKTRYYSRYAYHKSMQRSLDAGRYVPDKALAAAKSVVSRAESQLQAAKNGVDTLNEQLDQIAKMVSDAREKLDRLPKIEGEIIPLVTAKIEDGRVTAGVVGLYNGSVLTEGRVSLESPAEACLTVPTKGEVCVPL